MSFTVAKNKLHQLFLHLLIKHFFGEKVYRTVVPRNVRLSEAPSHGMPILAYERTSRGAEAYQAIAEEFLRRNQ